MRCAAMAIAFAAFLAGCQQPGIDARDENEKAGQIQALERHFHDANALMIRTDDLRSAPDARHSDLRNLGTRASEEWQQEAGHFSGIPQGPYAPAAGASYYTMDE